MLYGISDHDKRNLSLTIFILEIKIVFRFIYFLFLVLFVCLRFFLLHLLSLVPLLLSLNGKIKFEALHQYGNNHMIGSTYIKKCCGENKINDD